MAILAVQTPAEDGGLTRDAADPLGDSFANDGATFLLVENDSAGSVTVTVTAQKTSLQTREYGRVTKADGGGAVPAGGVEVFGPFPAAVFSDANRRVQVSYSAAVSVNVAAFKA